MSRRRSTCGLGGVRVEEVEWSCCHYEGQAQADWSRLIRPFTHTRYAGKKVSSAAPELSEEKVRGIKNTDRWKSVTVCHLYTIILFAIAAATYGGHTRRRHTPLGCKIVLLFSFCSFCQCPSRNFSLKMTWKSTSIPLPSSCSPDAESSLWQIWSEYNKLWLKANIRQENLSRVGSDRAEPAGWVVSALHWCSDAYEPGF